MKVMNYCYTLFGLLLNLVEGIDQNLVTMYHQDNMKSLGAEFDSSVAVANLTVSDEDLSLEKDSVFPKNCTFALENFSDTAMNLTRCSILNARPIQLCRKCGDELNATKKAYEILKAEPDVCQEIFFSSDQLGIIDTIYQDGEALWNKSNCQNCLKYPFETANFFNVSDELDACIQTSNKSSAVGNHTCKLCRDLYVKLNGIYNQFVHQQKEFDKGICMDVVDKMNITRRIWSTYHCVSYDTYIGYPNVVTAVLVGTMPLFFYLLARHVSIIEDVKIVRPKRKAFTSLPAE